MVQKAVVHKNKFNYLYYHIDNFKKSFSKTVANSSQLTESQKCALNNTLGIIAFIPTLINDFLPDKWVESTIRYPFDGFVAPLVNSLLYYLRESISVFDEKSSHFFDFDEKWIFYHKIDLNDIKELLTDYECNNTEEMKLKQKALASIDEILLNDNLEIDQSLIPLSYFNWKINYDDFEIKEKIGEGGYANVFKGIDKRNGKEVAIKMLKQGLDFNGNSLKFFRREIASLADNFPCFVKFIGVTENPYCIIMEYMPNGSLGNHVHQLTPLLKTMTAYDIARGMGFLHSKGIIHRDLKSFNILFDSDFHAHISDLGFSRMLSSDNLLTKRIGTVQWMAPELFQNNVSYDSKIDVYSYGILLWELVTEKRPYENMQLKKITENVNKNKRPDIPNNVSQQLKDLITSCWDSNPNKRPTFDQIVQKFKNEDLTFDGTDINEFKKYIKETENCFEKDLNTLLNENNVSKKEVCAKKLLKNKISIDKEDAIKIAQFLPTDSKKLNKYIVILACKNGAADYVLINSKYNPHIKFALVMIIKQKTYSSLLKTAITDICIQGLKSNDDDSFSCIAYRCLIFINETQKIPMNIFQKHLISNNQSLKNCMLIALIQNIYNKNIQEIPNDILDYLYNDSQKNKVAFTTLLYCCNNIEAATNIIHKLDSNNVFLEQNEDMLRLLYVISKHKKLHSNVIEFLESINNRNHDFQELYELLNS